VYDGKIWHYEKKLHSVDYVDILQKLLFLVYKKHFNVSLEFFQRLLHLWFVNLWIFPNPPQHFITEHQVNRPNCSFCSSSSDNDRRSVVNDTAGPQGWLIAHLFASSLADTGWLSSEPTERLRSHRYVNYCFCHALVYVTSEHRLSSICKTYRRHRCYVNYWPSDALEAARWHSTGSSQDSSIIQPRATHATHATEVTLRKNTPLLAYPCVLAVASLRQN